MLVVMRRLQIVFICHLSEGSTAVVSIGIITSELNVDVEYMTKQKSPLGLQLLQSGKLVFLS